MNTILRRIEQLGTEFIAFNGWAKEVQEIIDICAANEKHCQCCVACCDKCHCGAARKERKGWNYRTRKQKRKKKMRGNTITPKQLIADAKGKERFMPSDIAFDTLEDFATKGCRFEQVERLREGCTLTKTKNGWKLTAADGDIKELKGKSLPKLLDKAGL